MSKKQKMVEVEVDIPTELYDRLVPVAEKLQVPIETVVAAALTDFVKRETERLKKEKKENK
jgi:predicted transcriptional regulator